MPNYDYKCPKCSKVIEVSFGVHEVRREIVCESCKVTMTKQYAKVAAIFRGTGWGGQ